MTLEEILAQVQMGGLSPEAAGKLIRQDGYKEMDYAKLDTGRKARTGFAEVIYCSNKADAHLLKIFERLYMEEGEVLGTRASQAQYELVKEKFPEVQYDPVSRILKIEKPDKIHDANCVVAVAGMEGALASVMGGLVSRPVIAVPTSVGYGANFHGLSALLTMINSCANGIATVNIDNGYGAGYLATQMNRLALGK